MWTIKYWKLKGCRNIGTPDEFSYDNFETREEALAELKKRLDLSVAMAESRLRNAKKWVAKAKDFGLYPMDDAP